MARRRKISTTIDPYSYAYLKNMIARGKARNLAEALDLALSRFRRVESRARLEQATAAYFENLPEEAAREELDLAEALDLSADESDFERG